MDTKKVTGFNPVFASEEGIFTTETYEGVKIEVHYVDNENKTVDIVELRRVIAQEYNRSVPYFGKEFYKNLTIKVYDKYKSDIPASQYQCDDTACRLQYGIKDYDGLATGQTLIQLNNKSLGSAKEIADCYSHEIGHCKSDKAGFFQPGLLRDHYHNIRQLSGNNTAEIIAEDYRYYHGSDLTYQIARNDAQNPYKQANEIQGLAGMLKVWPVYTEYKKNAEARGAKIHQLTLLHNPGDQYNGFYLWFLEDYGYNHPSNCYIKIGQDGLCRFINSRWTSPFMPLENYVK